jgi:hypothetical protein
MHYEDTMIGARKKILTTSRLERATAEYFEKLSPEEIADENAVGDAMSAAASKVLFDE